MTNRSNRLLSSKRLRALLLGGLAVLAGVELLWLVGVNWALSSGLVEKRINRRPEKLEVKWDRARTAVIPGRVSVEGLSVRGQSKKQQWYVEAEQARVHLSLTALLRRTFRTYSVKATGVDFRLRKRQAAAEAPPEAQHWPSIPGLAADAPLPPPPAKRRSKRPWVTDLRDVRIDGVKQVWMLHYRLAGQGTLGVNLRAEVRGPLSIDRAVGALHGVEIFVRGSQIAHQTSLDLEASLEPFLPSEVKGRAAMRLLSGSVAFTGKATTSDAFNQMFQRFASIEVGDSGDTIVGELLVGRGKLLEGSHYEFSPSDGWLEFLDWRAQGAADSRFEVRGAGEPNPSILTVSLEGVEVFDKNLELPVLEGADIELTAAAPAIDLTQDFAALSDSLSSVHLDLTGATVTDITRLTIPPVEDFSIDSGKVVVESHVVVRREASEGWLEATGEGLGATYGDVAMTGDLSVRLNAATGALDSRLFALSDSSIAIDNVTIGEGEKAQEGWYAHLDIREGMLSLAEPKKIEGAIELRMKDSRPLVALLQHRRPFIKKLRGILDFSDLEGQASLSMAADGLLVEEVDLAGDGIHVMTRLRIAGSEASGIFYSRVHGIPLGVDLRGEKPDLVFRRPKRWYETQATLEESPPD